MKPFDSFGMWMCEQMTWICAHHEAETLRFKANGLVQRVAIHYSNESHRCVNRKLLVDCLYRPRRLVASMFHELDCLVKYSWNGNRGNWIVWFPRNCYFLNVLFSTRCNQPEYKSKGTPSLDKDTKSDQLEQHPFQSVFEVKHMNVDFRENVNGRYPLVYWFHILIVFKTLTWNVG